MARRALQSAPRADHAVSILLQAAARSAWQGDPESLIPEDLAGSEHADLGLAEFLRDHQAARAHEVIEEFLRFRGSGVDFLKRNPDVALQGVGEIAVLPNQGGGAVLQAVGQSVEAARDLLRGAVGPIARADDRASGQEDDP